MRKRMSAILVVALFILASSLAFAGEHSVGDFAQIVKPTPIPAGQFAIIAKHADEYLSGVAHRTIFAETLVDGINDPANPYDDLSDFFILDVRQTKDYDAGHIAGAVNVPFAEVAKPENLAMYPVDRPILVVCYTGHTASTTMGILNTLGYDAWVLRFGMMSWSAATNMKVYSPTRSQVINGGGYPQVINGGLSPMRVIR